nr:Fic family protein [Lewinella cohaerens]
MHFWFIIIHPFDDGSGRVARVLSDLLLARSEESSQSVVPPSYLVIPITNFNPHFSVLAIVCTCTL